MAAGGGAAVTFSLFDLAFLGAAGAFAASPTDPYFANVSLLLHGDGTNGSTTIVDSSPSPKTVTAVGNAQISTAQSKFGGASLYLPGGTDGSPTGGSADSSITTPNSAGFRFGSGDYTIEFWLYAAAQNIAPICNQTSLSGTNGWSLWIYDNVNIANVTRKLTLFVNGANFVLVTPGDAFTDNTWTHIAVVKNGTGTNNTTIYSNGASLAQGTAPTMADNTAQIFAIGSTRTTIQWNTNYIGTFYIDDLRITKGVARYTANFTPPTAPFPDI